MNAETVAALTYLRSGPYRNQEEVRKHLREILLPTFEEEQSWWVLELRAAAAEAFIEKVDCAEVILRTGTGALA